MSESETPWSQRMAINDENVIKTHKCHKGEENKGDRGY